MITEVLAQITPAPGENTSTGRLILQIAGVVIGGGLLQLIIFLLKRRATLRSLDTTSDATQLTSANELIVILQSEIKFTRDELKACKEEIAKLRQKLERSSDDASRTLSTTEDTITRLTLELARARSDVAVLRAELTDITDNTKFGRHGKE